MGGTGGVKLGFERVGIGWNRRRVDSGFQAQLGASECLVCLCRVRSTEQVGWWTLEADFADLIFYFDLQNID